MNDQLRNLLTPVDDGRGFTEAVLLRASGALARRRAASAESNSAWTWLERWARPWVLGAITALALLAVLPAITPDASGVAANEPAEVLLASPQQDVTMTVAWGR